MGRPTEVSVGLSSIDLRELGEVDRHMRAHHQPRRPIRLFNTVGYEEFVEIDKITSDEPNSGKFTAFYNEGGQVGSIPLTIVSRRPIALRATVVK